MNFENSVLQRSLAAISKAMGENKEMQKQHPNRLAWDEALHIYTALKRAGLKVIRDRQAKPEDK